MGQGPGHQEITMSQELTVIKTTDNLRLVLAGGHQKQLVNFFGDEKKALRFLSAVVAAAQRTPELLECTKESVINSFMTMASLGFLPSSVSGEAYVLPYDNRKAGVIEAQFQLGYQGIVTLLYRAGVKSIVSEIVYEKDQFRITNGHIVHEPDVFSDDRGKPKGAYAIITLKDGGQVEKVMSKKEILEIAERYSKSYKSNFSPWKNDAQLWMWKKTVLKQAAKLAPKNDDFAAAIGEDNRDSNIEEKREEAAEQAERRAEAEETAKALTMGAVKKEDETKTGPKSECAECSKLPEGEVVKGHDHRELEVKELHAEEITTDKISADVVKADIAEPFETSKVRGGTKKIETEKPKELSGAGKVIKDAAAKRAAEVRADDEKKHDELIQAELDGRKLTANERNWLHNYEALKVKREKAE